MGHIKNPGSVTHRNCMVLPVTAVLFLCFRLEVPGTLRVPSLAWLIKPSSLLLRLNPWKPCLKLSCPLGSTGWTASGKACLCPDPPVKQSFGHQVTLSFPCSLENCFSNVPGFRQKSWPSGTHDSYGEFVNGAQSLHGWNCLWAQS